MLGARTPTCIWTQTTPSTNGAPLITLYTSGKLRSTVGVTYGTPLQAGSWSGGGTRGRGCSDEINLEGEIELPPPFHSRDPPPFPSQRPLSFCLCACVGAPVWVCCIVGRGSTAPRVRTGRRRVHLWTQPCVSRCFIGVACASTARRRSRLQWLQCPSFPPVRSIRGIEPFLSPRWRACGEYVYDVTIRVSRIQ